MSIQIYTTQIPINHQKPHIHAIVGPTCVGKSAEAERLAKQFDCPIVVADRIQCYTDLKITSARVTNTPNEITRHYLAQLQVADGEILAKEAAQSMQYTIGALSRQHKLIIVEGGSISLLKEVFCSNKLPFTVSVDVLSFQNPQTHRQNLLQRAKEMLSPPQHKEGLLEEIAAAWHITEQRNFVSSINGPEAVLAWCQQNNLPPANLPSLRNDVEAVDELASTIADAHLIHAEEQQQAFASLFGQDKTTHPPRFPKTIPTQQTNNSTTRTKVAVFCGARLGHSPNYKLQAEELGKQLAKQGFDIVYGGASIGCMGALADGALNAGGKVIGVIPQGMMQFEIAHNNLTELHVVNTMHERKALMEQLADAFIALPGGLGTAEELLEILTWKQLGIHNKPCFLLDVDSFWSNISLALAPLMDAGFINHSDVQNVQLYQDSQQIINALLNSPQAQTNNEHQC